MIDICDCLYTYIYNATSVATFRKKTQNLPAFTSLSDLASLPPFFSGMTHRLDGLTLIVSLDKSHRYLGSGTVTSPLQLQIFPFIQDYLKNILPRIFKCDMFVYIGRPRFLGVRFLSLCCRGLPLEDQWWPSKGKIRDISLIT